MDERDNVAVTRVRLGAGERLLIAGREIAAREEIPAGHKIAIAPIAAGEKVLRYGEAIGLACVAIPAGAHAHTGNVSYEELSPAYEYPPEPLPFPTPPASMPTFLGYARPDGRAGTRNHIAVMAASNCAAHVANLVARSYEGETLPENVDGVVAFPHGDGCGHAIGPDTEMLERIINGVLDHPNVSGALIIGLGCEVNQLGNYLSGAMARDSRLVGLALQTSGGTPGTVQAARREIQRLMERASAERRVELPASKLCLGLNCGGSDSFSGITSNPALGACTDMLARLGATAVLAETPEVFGAEHLLARRARSREVAERFLGLVQSYKAYLAQFGSTFNDNPSPGNKEGGLTTILEKSLGAVAKGGTGTLMDAFQYAERVNTPGLVFMSTPGYDPVSLTGLGAGGVNLIAFTTGRGSAIGFPTIPVLKISSNTHIWRAMRDNMDLNAGRIADGELSIEAMGREIFDLLLDVASGRKTASERWGHGEFVPWRIGPFT
jgi:altronate hydrolase